MGHAKDGQQCADDRRWLVPDLQYGWCMSYCMLVEINTWLLIAKRTFPNKQVWEGAGRGVE